MKIFKNLWGLKSDKTRPFAIIYYFFCISFIIIATTGNPDVYTSNYDLFICRLTNFLVSFSFLAPALFLSFYKIKDNKIIKTIIFLGIFMFMSVLGTIVDSLHTEEYKIKYKDFYETEIKEPNIITPTIEDNQIVITPTPEDKPVVNEKPKEDKPVIEDKTVVKKDIKMHFIDVGQGDAIFIELPNNETMLIDAGDSNKGPTVKSYIKKLNYSKIDYLVATHPHADHIGGLPEVIKSFTIGKVYMPKVTTNTKTFERLLDTLISKDLKATPAKAGVNIINNNDLKINIIAPVKDNYKNLNDNSAVIKINYINKSFLFMGDAEEASEKDITANVKSDVIKVGHHGSNTASSIPFVNKVKAKYAIIMLGENNRYNHPHQITLDTWNNIGTTIYRTDLNGNIIVTSDGNNIEIKTERK